MLYNSMHKTDARTLNQDEQYQIRKVAIRLREHGMSYREISDDTGLSATYIGTHYNRYKRHGDKAIEKSVRGRRR